MAKFSLLSALAIPLVPVAMFACGGDDGTHVTVKPDAAGSGSGSGSAVTCNAKADYGTPTFTKQGAKFTAGSGSDLSNDITWTGTPSGSDAIRLIIIGGCAGSGSANCKATPDWPGAFGPKPGLDLATATDVLFLVLANPDTTKYNDIYLATAGTLDVTAAGNGSGQSFMANATNVETVHVDLSGTQIMEHADGCTSNIANITMMATTTAIGKPLVVDPNDERYEALRQYIRNRHQ